MKKIYLLSLIPLLLTACSQNKNIDNVSDFENQLSNLDGVSSFDKIEIEENYKNNNVFKNSYLLTFNTPIDWNNPSLGYFNQRVFIGYKGKDKVNTFYVSGYGLNDSMSDFYFQVCPGNELSNRYDGNFISIEYRFFYKSKPADFSILGTKYLDYLNSDEASHDFHNIITKLKTVLTGKNIFTGESKGGFATEAMAYYYPNDIDSFVSYVAPLCDSDTDLRYSQYLFTEIGNGGLGIEEASKKRQQLLTFSHYALDKNRRGTYLEWLNEGLSNPSISITNRSTLDETWEAAVFEASVATWQYFSGFDKVEQILSMQENTDEEKAAKTKAVFDYVFTEKNYPLNINRLADYVFPYYFQVYSEIGNYAYSFKYLEDAGCYITTSEENQKTLFKRLTLTEEQEKHIHYSPVLRNRLIDFMDTTNLDIVKIVGYNDTWYSVKAPETVNTHIHLYKENGCHTSNISNLDEESKNACRSIIDNLVK